MSEALWAGILLALSAAGFLDALWFTLVAYRLVRPDPRWLPAFCRMEEAACARVVDTRWGRLGGLPNSVYGVAWYAAVGATSVAGIVKGALPWCGLLIAGAAAAVLVSLSLAWALLVRLRTPCPLCFAAHGVNVATLLAVLAACGVPGPCGRTPPPPPLAAHRQGSAPRRVSAPTGRTSVGDIG